MQTPAGEVHLKVVVKLKEDKKSKHSGKGAGVHETKASGSGPITNSPAPASIKGNKNICSLIMREIYRDNDILHVF